MIPQYLGVETSERGKDLLYIEWSPDAIAFALANKLPIDYYRIDVDTNRVPTLVPVNDTGDLRR